MKILFFLALLANLVFFLWQYHAGAFHHPADDMELVEQNPKQILLLSEVKKNPTVNAPASLTLTAPATIVARPEKNNPQHLVTSTIVTEAVKTAPTIPASVIATTSKAFHCYQIKGFADKESVTRWAQQQSLDETALQINETQPVVADYLVYYPAAPTLAESNKSIETLKAQGIKDFFIIRDGEFKGAVSLGVFKSEARALNSQSLLTQKGIQAQIGKHYKTATAISAHVKTEKTRPQLLATLIGLTRRPSVELLSKCD